MLTSLAGHRGHLWLRRSNDDSALRLGAQGHNQEPAHRTGTLVGAWRPESVDKGDEELQKMVPTGYRCFCLLKLDLQESHILGKKILFKN